MKGRTLSRIILAAVAIGIGMGLLLQLVLLGFVPQQMAIPAAVILVIIAAASQWEWVRDEAQSEEMPVAAPAPGKEDE